jgi:hypothetical protein
MESIIRKLSTKDLKDRIVTIIQSRLKMAGAGVGQTKDLVHGIVIILCKDFRLDGWELL